MTSNQINSLSPVGEWIFLDTGVATAPAGTDKIHAFTLFVDYSGSEIAQGVYFDDLSCVHSMLATMGQTANS